MMACSLCDSLYYRHKAEFDANHYFCSRDCYMEWREINRKRDVYKKIGAKHQHRVLAESVLGRALTADEVVHHIDEDKHNNAIENLAVFPKASEHMRCHTGKMSSAELDKCRLTTLRGVA